MGVTSNFVGYFEEKAKKNGWWNGEKYALHIVITAIALIKKILPIFCVVYRYMNYAHLFIYFESISLR